MGRKQTVELTCDICGFDISKQADDGKGYDYWECTNHEKCGMDGCLVLHTPIPDVILCSTCMIDNVFSKTKKHD